MFHPPLDSKHHAELVTAHKELATQICLDLHVELHLVFRLLSIVLARPYRFLFSEFFSKFSQIFLSFREFFEVFGRVRTCLDPFGSVRMHSDTFGCIQMRSNAFGRIQKIYEIWEFFVQCLTFFLRILTNREKYLWRNL